MFVFEISLTFYIQFQYSLLKFSSWTKVTFASYISVRSSDNLLIGNTIQGR